MVKAKYWKTIITTKIEPPKTLTTYFHAFVAPPRGMVIFKIISIILKKFPILNADSGSDLNKLWLAFFIHFSLQCI